MDKIPCPINISNEDIVRQEENLRKWNEGMSMMRDCYAFLGVEQGWKGWVEGKDYKLMKDKLQSLYHQFLDVHAKSEDERTQWAKVWPFQDSDVDTPL